MIDVDVLEPMIRRVMLEALTDFACCAVACLVLLRFGQWCFRYFFEEEHPADFTEP